MSLFLITLLIALASADVSHLKYGKNNPYQNNMYRGSMRFNGRKVPQTPARSDEPPPPPPSSGYEYIPPNNSYLPPDVSLVF